LKKAYPTSIKIVWTYLTKTSIQRHQRMVDPKIQ
jgi:hypothetical protein